MSFIHCRSYSPALRRRDDYSASPGAKEEHGRSPRQAKEHDGNKKRRSYAPDDRSNLLRGAANGHDE
jgi:FUS-interacting serine-arginine-rich protein 1